MGNCLLSCVAKTKNYKNIASDLIYKNLVVKIVPAHAVITETNIESINGDVYWTQQWSSLCHANVIFTTYDFRVK